MTAADAKLRQTPTEPFYRFEEFRGRALFAPRPRRVAACKRPASSVTTATRTATGRTGSRARWWACWRSSGRWTATRLGRKDGLRFTLWLMAAITAGAAGVVRSSSSWSGIGVDASLCLTTRPCARCNRAAFRSCVSFRRSLSDCSGSPRVRFWGSPPILGIVRVTGSGGVGNSNPGDYNPLRPAPGVWSTSPQGFFPPAVAESRFWVTQPRPWLRHPRRRRRCPRAAKVLSHEHDGTRPESGTRKHGPPGYSFPSRRSTIQQPRTWGPGSLAAVGQDVSVLAAHVFQSVSKKIGMRGEVPGLVQLSSAAVYDRSGSPSGSSDNGTEGEWA